MFCLFFTVVRYTKLAIRQF